MYLFKPVDSIISFLVFYTVCMPLRSLCSFAYMFAQSFHLRCKTGLMNKKFAETTRGVFAYFLKNGFLKSCAFFTEKTQDL